MLQSDQRWLRRESLFQLAVGVTQLRREWHWDFSIDKGTVIQFPSWDGLDNHYKCPVARNLIIALIAGLGFDPQKTLDNFDFTFNPKMNRGLVFDLGRVQSYPSDCFLWTRVSQTILVVSTTYKTRVALEKPKNIDRGM